VIANQEIQLGFPGLSRAHDFLLILLAVHRQQQQIPHQAPAAASRPLICEAVRVNSTQDLLEKPGNHLGSLWLMVINSG